MDFQVKNAVVREKHKCKGPKTGAYILSPRGFKEEGQCGRRAVSKRESDRKEELGEVPRRVRSLGMKVKTLDFNLNVKGLSDGYE